MILANDSPIKAAFSLENGFRLTNFLNGELEVIYPEAPFFVGLHLQSNCPEVPWNGEKSEESVTATLTGEDVWNGNSLAKLEKQGFKLQSTALLDGDTLRLHHFVVSDTDSLAGNFFHLRLPQGDAEITIDVKHEYYDSGKLKSLPADWKRSEDGGALLPLNIDYNAGFHPFLNPIGGVATLKTADYTAEIGYESTNQESAWLIQYKKGAPYVSIGAVSSQDPWKPNLTASSISLSLRILSQ